MIMNGFWLQPTFDSDGMPIIRPRGGNFTHASAWRDEEEEGGIAYKFSRCYHPTIDDAIACISRPYPDSSIERTDAQFPVKGLRPMTIHAVFKERIKDSEYLVAVYEWADEER